MAYTYDFKDNVVYGADDINAIRASILTKGVVEEASDSLKAVKSGNGVTILKGQAIFGDGCKIEVDADGVELEITQGVKNYIYLYNNTLAGVCEVLAKTTAPTGDYVLLAEIDAQGNITDKREFAQLKTADKERYAASFSAELKLTNTMKAGDLIGEIVLPKSNCSYIESYVRFAGQTPMMLSIYPKEDCFVQWRYVNGGNGHCGDTIEFAWYSKSWDVKFELSGNILALRLISVPAQGENYTISFQGVCMR